MFTIGDSVRHGRVSVRMLRHYGATRHAAIAVFRVGDDRAGLSVAELPGGPAATVIHRGAMDEVLPAWQSIAHWIEANDYVSQCLPREIYLEVPDDETEG